MRQLKFAAPDPVNVCEAGEPCTLPLAIKRYRRAASSNEKRQLAARHGLQNFGDIRTFGDISEFSGNLVRRSGVVYLPGHRPLVSPAQYSEGAFSSTH